MPILYSAIARGSTILCSHQSTIGNFEEVMVNILPNIPLSQDARTSYTGSNGMTFHVMIESGLIYLCATESDDGKRQPYGFLNEIKHQFMSGSLAHRAQFAIEGELNRDFQPVLVSQMERFSEPGGGDQISSLQSQVEEVKGVMTQNIERVLERGQRLEDLMDKTTDLEANAQTFKKTSHRVQRKMWWKNTRWTIIMILVSILVVAIIIIIILFATGVLPPKSSGGNQPISTTPKSTTPSG
jgi:vesicle-associated membrane protein 7